jgi:hypothetical protein
MGWLAAGFCSRIDGPISKPDSVVPCPGQPNGPKPLPSTARASCRAVPVPGRINGLRAGLSGRGLSGHL